MKPLAAGRSHYKIATLTVKTRRIPAHGIKAMLMAGSGLIMGKKYFDVSDLKYADMTLMFNLIKDLIKGRENK